MCSVYKLIEQDNAVMTTGLVYLLFMLFVLPFKKNTLIFDGTQLKSSIFIIVTKCTESKSICDDN